MDDPLISLLANYQLFHGLTTEQLRTVRDAGIVQTFEPGTYIVRQGDKATSAYLLLNGSAKLTNISPDGRQALHSFVRPGHGYGVSSVLGDVDFTWSVQAIDGCRFLIWHGETMIQLINRYSLIMFNVLKLIVRSRQELEERYMELITLNVEQRLARALLRLCSDVGTEAPEGCLIDVALSRSDLAEYTGTTVYSASRMLQGWERQGLVRTIHDRIVVVDKDALKTIGMSAE